MSGVFTKVGPGVEDQMPNVVAPLQTTGDGNCLLHAVSRALWGSEIYNDLLRQLITLELQSNLDWYKEHAKIEEDWDVVSLFFPLQHFYSAQLVAQSMTEHESLQFIHVQALSNSIRRPILMYCSIKDKVVCVHFSL